jgi:hypothetical protein
MKKQILLIFIFFLIAEEGLSQITRRTGFGLRAGINAATINTNGNTDFSFNFGPMGGIYTRFGLFQNLTIQPELLYSQQGGEFNVTNGNVQQTTISDRLHYLNLPILLQFWLNDNLNVHVGPYGGVLLDVNSDGRNNINANYERWDYGGTVGLEYEFNFGFNFGARYNRGFSDIAGVNHNVGTNGPVANGNNTNQFFQLYIGWTF